MFLLFLFYVGFVFGMFLSIVIVLFLVMFLVLLSDNEKHCSPCNSSVFLESCWLEGGLCLITLFMLDAFVIVFYCVVCIQSKQQSCIVLCLCGLLSLL